VPNREGTQLLNPRLKFANYTGNGTLSNGNDFGLWMPVE